MIGFVAEKLPPVAVEISKLVVPAIDISASRLLPLTVIDSSEEGPLSSKYDNPLTEYDDEVIAGSEDAT